MRNLVKKLTLFVMAVVLCLGTLSIGCTPNGGVNDPVLEDPTTNLTVLDFSEDLEFKIFADRPPKPTRQYLLDYMDAGFNFYNMTEDDQSLTNVDGVYGTEDDGVINKAYIDALELCDELGLKAFIRNFYTNGEYFVNDNDDIRRQPTTGTTFRMPKRNITTELTELNAVAGYYMGDEPSWDQIDTLVPLVDWYNQNGGNTFFHLNLLQSYGSFLFEGHTYAEYVDKYCDVILKNINGSKYLGTDYYPLLEDKAGNAYIKNGILGDYFVLANKVKAMNAEITEEANKVVQNLCMQAYQSASTREMKTTADISFQANLAAAFGARSYQFYLYRSFSPGDGCVTSATHEKLPLYYCVKEAISQLDVLADVLMKFEWQGAKTYSGMQINDSNNQEAFDKVKDYVLDSLGLVSNVVARLDTVVGEFKDANGNKGYMITSYSDPAHGLANYVNVFFANNINKAVVCQDGEIKVVEVKNNKMQLKLSAGGGAFVYPYLEGGAN